VEQAPSAEASDGASAADANLTSPAAKRARGTAGAAAADPTLSFSDVAFRDVDASSVILSFLSNKDFLSAIQCSRLLQAAGMRRTAWPRLSVQLLVQTLRDDDYDNDERRRLRLHVQSKDPQFSLQLLPLRGDAGASANAEAVGGAGAAALPAAGESAASTSSSPLVQLASSAVSSWRYATDVYLTCARLQKKDTPEEKCFAVLRRVLSMPYLDALTLIGIAIADSDMATVLQLFAAASHLQALVMFKTPSLLRRCLPQLTQLRVLVLDKLPSAEALVPLTQLYYIHLSFGQSQCDHSSIVGLVLRWLSVHHALRCVSLVAASVDCSQLDQVLRPAQVEASIREQMEEVKHARAVSQLQLQPPLDYIYDVVPPLDELAMKCKLRPHHYRWIARIPSLRRLQADMTGADLRSLPRKRLANLRELRLVLFDSSGWTTLARCTQLRTLQLQPQAAFMYHSVPLAEVAAVLTASAATLESVNVGVDWLIQQQEQTSWAALAQCRQLTSLALRLQPLDWDTLLAALNALPHFRTLALHVTEGYMFELPAGLLRCMTTRTESQWRTLQLHLRDGCKITVRSGVNPLAKLLPLAEVASDAAAQQVRVLVSQSSSRTRTFLITDDRAGRHQWIQM